MKKVINIIHNTAMPLLVLVSMVISSRVQAAMPPDTVSANSYLQAAEAFLALSPNLQFNATRYEKVVQGGVTSLDTGTVYYYYNQGNYQVYFEGLMELQNETNNLVVESGYAVNILKRTPLRLSLLKFDLLDPVFIRSYVKDLYVVDSSGYKKLKVQFNGANDLLQYEMVFDTTGMLPLSLQYKVFIDDGTTTGGYQQVKLDFYNIHTDSTGMDIYFRTDLFITRVNGQYQLTPAYSTYNLFDYSAY